MCCESKIMIGWSMKYEVEGSRPSGRPKRTWRVVVEKDCQARKLDKVDAMDRSRWRKLIKDVWWSGWMWVCECIFWYRPPGSPESLNSCVCACARVLPVRSIAIDYRQNHFIFSFDWVYLRSSRALQISACCQGCILFCWFPFHVPNQNVYFLVKA